MSECACVALMPSYYCTVSLVLYAELLHSFVLLFTFYFCIVTHVHTTHAVILYKLYVVENKKFSADSMCVCEVKRPAHANSTGAIASDATCVCVREREGECSRASKLL